MRSKLGFVSVVAVMAAGATLWLGTAGALARTVTVPKVHGGLGHAYAMLHRAGLRVTIRAGFTFRSDQTVVVKRVIPAAGTKVRRGAAVRLTVSCCERVRHPAKLAKFASLVPNLLGYSATTASRWARQSKLRFTAHLGPLRAAAESQLLDNYRVTSQTPVRGRKLISRRVKGRPRNTRVGPLQIRASEGRVAPCLPPLYGATIMRDGVAVISAAPNTDPDQGGTDYFGCVFKIDRQVRFGSSFINSEEGGGASAGPFKLAGTELAVQSSSFSGKAMACEASLDVGNLSTDRWTHLFGWDCETAAESVQSFVVNARGFVGWHVVDTPGNEAQAFGGVSCPTVSLCVAIDRNGTVFTSTAPTGGRSAWAAAAIPNAGPLTGVSCPSANLCVAVAGQRVLTSTNPTGGAGAWTATPIQGVPIDSQLFSVSCQLGSLCVAVGSNGIATSTNPTGGAGAWSYGTVAASHDLTGVSCPSSSLCVAGDGEGTGDVYTSTNPAAGASTWSPAHVDSDQVITGVACPSTALCVADDGDGGFVASSNPAGGPAAWSTAGNVTGAEFSSLSCPTSSLCVAGSQNGIATATAPSTGPWTVAKIPGGQGMTGVACPTANLCVGVNSGGEITGSGAPTQGAGAWAANLVDSPPCSVAGGCDAEQIYVHDQAGTRVIDSVPGGAGNQLENLSLAGDQLSWTHDGSARSAALG